MELTGTWRAAAADEGLRRVYPQPGYDDSGWATVRVPGHWRSDPAFSAHDGPLLYRRHFETAAPTEGRRRWLVLDGLFYQGDVWLDGSYVGDTEGYFFPHTFEVTDALAERSEHVLAVEVTCAPQRDRTAKRNITGVFQHWDCLDPDWNPGGIWRPVRIEDTGPVRIDTLRVRCPEATDERALLNLRSELLAAEAQTVVLRTTVGDIEIEEEHPLAAGLNRISWTVPIDNPRLWWPHSLGDQPMYDVAVAVVLPSQGHLVSHRRTLRTGLRQVRMKDWIFTVNGERLFLKGANQGPTRMELADATAADFKADVDAAIAAHLDLLRLHAHISRPEIYEAADDAGILLWQDFPLQWGYARSIRRQAARQAAAAVDLLAHHPSVAIWCAHNEPMTLDVEPGGKIANPAALAAKFITQQQLPTWNKTVLDRSVKRALEGGDGSRPVIAHSGVLPHPGSGGTDSHLYFGWYHGDERDLPRLFALFPRMARFVSEFGAQAVPETDDFMEPARWPDLDWGRLARTHALQKDVFDKHVPPAAFATFAEWKAATQDYQANLLRRHIETLRRLKYRPTGGFCQFSFADAHPAVTWSVLGHDRKEKAGYSALRAACAPVIVVADRPDAVYRPGQSLALDVHVVSDLRREIDAAEVDADLSWPGGEHRWSWTGAVPADACVRVGTVQAVVPDASGELRLELTLRAGTVEAANSYVATIAGSASASDRIL